VYEGAVQELIDELGRLPGVGPKSAQRLAFHILEADPQDMKRLVEAITTVKERVKFCAACGNVTEQELCNICRDPRRDPSVICVVEESKDVLAVERTRSFRGRYHVLGGAINPIAGVGPEQLRIRELLNRLSDGAVQEIIIATDPNLEGEATATYLARMLQSIGIAVTRLGFRAACGRRPGVRGRSHPGQGLRGPPECPQLTARVTIQQRADGGDKLLKPVCRRAVRPPGLQNSNLIQ
jgi:recombination protein RecR